MPASTITIRVKMDRKTLRSFALFDTFLLKKQWKKPIGFAAILLVFAVICFLSGKNQSTLLGVVLLIVGLGLPVVYVSMFLSQVKEKAKKMRLDPPRKVYTLTLSPDGVNIHNDMKVENDVHLPWNKIPAAFRMRSAVYLYAAPTKAFILPDGQADASPAEVWDYLVKHLPEGRTNVRKK